jgi:SAM-dependent methyltransferase
MKKEDSDRLNAIMPVSQKIGYGGSGSDERKKLFELSLNKNNVLEIGCMMGQTTVLLCESAKKVHVVDVFDDYEKISNDRNFEHYKGLFDKLGSNYCKFKENTKKYKNLVINKMSSKEYALMVENDFFDLVFVDADHSFEGCSEDIKNFHKKVKVGGVIAFHDTNHDKWGEGITKAINLFLPDNFEHFETIRSTKFYKRLS